MGAGASAVEAAVLVTEAGGRARLVVRAGQLVFHGRMPRSDRSTSGSATRSPSSALDGRAGSSQALPLAVRFLPEAASQ